MVTFHAFESAYNVTSSPVNPQYSKHLFVHIAQTNPSFTDPLLEAVDIRQIYDKFPEKKGGLKELYEKGPQNAFFLVKFWVGFYKCMLIIQSILLSLKSVRFQFSLIWWSTVCDPFSNRFFFCNVFQADLNSSNVQDGPGSFYGVSSQYSSAENMTITVSTKVCSFGKQVVEKVEVSYNYS